MGGTTREGEDDARGVADDEAVRGAARLLVAALAGRGMSIATAESCTGGLLAGALVGVPGVSACFPGGVVAYANRAKRAMLGVPGEIIGRAGAVSRECAAAMAEGIRDRLGVSMGLATTGVAGPGGGTAGKPAGLVYVAASLRGETRVERNVFQGDRETVRRRGVLAALRLAGEMLPPRPKGAACPRPRPPPTAGNSWKFV